MIGGSVENQLAPRRRFCTVNVITDAPGLPGNQPLYQPWRPRTPSSLLFVAEYRMNIATRFLLELQEMSLLAGRATRGLFKKPRYVPETIAQMDSIGVGSLTIIILTGFFTGGVLTLQTYQTLASYGAVDQLGYLVSISLVRELGPVLTALMVTGRVVSAISAELGSMVVSE